MEEILRDFQAIKISALSKSAKLNQHINEVTIGPNAIQPQTKVAADTLIITVKNDPLDSRISQRVVKQIPSPYKIDIIKIEEKRKENLQEAISSRVKKVIEHDKLQKVISSQEWARRQQILLEKNILQERSIIKMMEEHDLHSDQEKLRNSYFQQDMRQKRREQDKIIKLKQERHKKTIAIIETVQKGQMEYRNIYQEICQVLKGAKEEIKPSLSDDINNLKQLSLKMEELMKKCKTGNVEEQDKLTSSEIVNAGKLLENRIKEIVANYEKQYLLALEAEYKLLEQKVAEEEAIEEKKIVKEANVADKVGQLSFFVSKSALKTFSELQLFLQQHTDNYKSLTEDNSLKAFKFDCNKVVNLAVNAISSVSPNHLLDKYNKLYNLLSGKPVQVDNSYVVATKHPQGISFCMNLIARKFVLQGDTNVSRNPESAFCYATVIVSLWADFPELGKLLLAHFYQQCPYLVPFYQSRSENQSDEDYYKCLGYEYNDNQIEKQDKFLARMRGIFRLYFAILITDAKQSQRQHQHPHDLRNGWTWFSRLVNIGPRPDITATALVEFFEVAGSSMQKVYGKQFKKVLYFISTSYLQLIKNLDSGGPTTRLELLLQEYNQNGYFNEPDGTLHKAFW